MRHSAPALLAAGLLLGGGLFALASRGAGAADPAVPRVAVVDVLGVMNDHPKKRAIEDKNTGTKHAIDDWAKETKTKIEKDQYDFEVVMPRSDPSRPARAKQIALEKTNYEFEVKWRLSEAQREYFDALEDLYKEVKDVIRAVAKEQGYHVVLNKTDDPLNVRTGDEFILNVAVRNVLYSDASVDLTPLVKTRVGTTPPGVPPPPPGPPPPAMAGGGLPPPGMG